MTDSILYLEVTFKFGYELFLYYLTGAGNV